MKKYFLLFAATGLINLTAFAQFSFVHITDLHVSDANSFVNGCDLDGELAHCYLQEFANLDPKPSFVVATGDVSNVGDNSSEGMYSALTQYLYPGPLLNPGPGDYFIDQQQTIPIYFTTGNHDYYSFLTPPINGSLEYYARDLSPDSDYVITNNIAVLICMNSGYDDNRPFWEDPNFISPEGSGLTDAQCSWLRNKLYAAGNKRKIIAFHHPAVNAAGTNDDGSSGSSPFDAADGCIKNNRTTFLNICDSNNVDIVLSGHEHQNVIADKEGNVVPDNWSGGTRYVQTSTALKSAYRIITVEPSLVTIGSPMRSCNATGANLLTDKQDMLVYPNPAGASITIETQERAAIEILNVEGQTVMTISSGSLKTTLDISALSNGVYIIKARTGNGTAIKKFLKQ